MLSPVRAAIVLLSMLMLTNTGLGAERFASAHGRFSILLPATPQLKEAPLEGGNAPPVTQYQPTHRHLCQQAAANTLLSSAEPIGLHPLAVDGIVVPLLLQARYA